MQKELEGDDDEIFSIKAFKDIIGSSFSAKSCPINSWEATLDNLTILVTLACGIYTLFLFTNTILYVRSQSSLVDSHKLERYNMMSKARKKAEEATKPSYLKKMPKLTFKELC